MPAPHLATVSHVPPTVQADIARAARAGGGASSPSPWEEVRAVSLPVLIGLLVRAIPLLVAGFPLNDGGLFYSMTQNILAAHFALPLHASYNGVGIPFVYPPLGFYLAALMAQAGIPLLTVFMLLPLAASVLTIPALYLLAREILPSRFQALLAAYAFAVLPRAFEWMIVGGGVTRSPGFLFAVLAIWQAARFYRTRSRRSAVAVAVLAGLTLLTHPEAALFGVVSVALLLVLRGRDLRALLATVAMGLGALIVSAPWWAVAIARFGPGPLLSGGQTGLSAQGTFQYLATFSFTDEPYLAFLGALGLIGALWCLSARRWLLPAWIVLLFIADQRGGATYAMVPLSMLVAVAVREILLDRLAQPGRVPVDDAADSRHRSDEPIWPRDLLRTPFGALVLAATLVLGVIGAVKSPLVPNSPLFSLSPANRDAMAWVASHTPANARFAVVSGIVGYIDATSEWFPVLAQRESIATIQGYEWKGSTSWATQEGSNRALEACAVAGVDCLRAWAGRESVAGDIYLYLPRGPLIGSDPADADWAASLRSSLRGATGVRVLYDGPGATVYRLAVP